MVELTSNSAKLKIRDFNFRPQFKYSVLSEPPILVDSGDFELDIQNLNSNLEITTLIDEDGLL